MKRCKFGIMLSDIEREHLDYLAAKDGVTPSQLLRRAIVLTEPEVFRARIIAAFRPAAKPSRFRTWAAVKRALEADADVSA